ncbi:cell wall binding repeat-containing protein [Clostridium sp. DL-VIII]|uniref:N-acetylmuramoyl-L-alanine amidase family protein n=1 Tax=Clostridium sp. DL-VIII TaxID=641107 RepID=UPI00023B048D|nr:N-acetylmuramoyl-L-alanine amidase family protein [Clostridium sp. DL-VIII]EHJ01900.1 cell wall binding repeat-containing protein [Clostridium sp. DL-VIII]
MIKRTNKIIALIMCATTASTLDSPIKVFADDTLQDKDGSFYNAVAYSNNKYLYDGYRGSSGDEKATYYNNGKYTELEEVDASDEAIKYGSTDVQVDNDGVEELFNLQKGQFEGESIKDQESLIKNKLISKLKGTKRYGSDVENYLNLDKQIVTNKSSFQDVWYEYTADYNGQDIKYVTTIDVSAKSNDDWDNITLKKGSGVTSSFGDSYQFWFSVTTNDAGNKESDGQPKTYNGDVQAASTYIAGRIKDYCGYDAEVIQENGRWVIQLVSDQKLDGDVITGHNGDISVSTEEVPSSHIKYVDDGGNDGNIGGNTNNTGGTNTTGAAVTPGGTTDNTGGTTGSDTDTITQYITTININAQTAHEWKNITLKAGDGITSDFGSSYQFWFSITDNDVNNKESDGQPKTYNGDVQAATEYIAERIKDYCGYDAKVVQENGKPVIQIISNAKLDESVILGYDDNISVTTKTQQVSSTSTTTGAAVTPGGTADNTGGTTGSDTITQYTTTIDINAQTAHDWRNITLKKGDGITSDFGGSYQFWFSITDNDPNNKESDGQPKTYNGDVQAATEYIAERIKDYCGYYAQVVQENGKPVIQIISNTKLDESVILGYDDNISVKTTTQQVNSTSTTTGAAVNITGGTTNITGSAGILQQSFPDVESVIVDNTKEPVYYGVVNDEGKYMDISVFANIKLGYTVNGKTKTVSIEKFGKKYGDENIAANLNSLEVLAQDSNYIYAEINVKFTSDSDISILYPDGTNSKNYILRFSKALGEKVDDAYTPKEAIAYEMNSESDFQSWLQPKVSDDWYNLDVFAKDGQLYTVRFNKNSPKNTNEIQCQEIAFKSSVDTAYNINRNSITKVNDPSVQTRMTHKKIETTDPEQIRNLMKPYYSIDSEGNLWVLGLQKIYEFNGGGFSEKYTVDSGINSLDVYNKDNIVAWEDSNGDDDSIYVTNINEYINDNANQANSANGDTDSNADNNSVSNNKVENSNGWVKTKLGWEFFDESGKQVKDSWIKVNDKWYLINKDGVMQTGWTNINETWYYLQSDGSMATGWTKSGDDWYYLQSNGSMATGWSNIDGSHYYLKKSGELSVGWVYDTGNWYHFGTDGEMITGWLKYNKKWYYFDEDGRMLSNTTINGYNLGSDGALSN